MDLTLTRSAVVRSLCVCVAVLVALHAAAHMLDMAELAAGESAVRRFGLDEERNLPSVFASGLLLSAGALLLAAWRARTGCPLILAVVFTFLAADEFLGIHELLDKVLAARFDTSGLFYFAWVVPFGGLATVTGLSALRWLRSLKPDVRRRMVAAGCLFVGGAILLEVAAGMAVQRSGYDTLLYLGLSTAEEALELAGVVLFVDALLRHVGRRAGAIHLTLPPFEDEPFTGPEASTTHGRRRSAA